ncbi:hypothetical protein D0T84_22350 [Dysgonomonas sp. 521]|uniref:hypothetical protein n=1 Tax=Dysgonomonas sp. 521 TaxID=2302932 RepID=UPI0013D0DFE8|nr:hypothetical protein [Dysgonomonas sp. 521]NDV97600.1 hypothetical protein [Dysgonomonas sp. 521]
MVKEQETSSFQEIIDDLENYINETDLPENFPDTRLLMLHLSVILSHDMLAKYSLKHLKYHLKGTGLLNHVEKIDNSIQEIHLLYEKVIALIMDFQSGHKKGNTVVTDNQSLKTP